MSCKMAVTEEEKYVQAQLDTMDDIGWDPEWLHSIEDNLYGWVLSAIANGYSDPVKLAGMALHTQQMDFPRWCA